MLLLLAFICYLCLLVMLVLIFWLAPSQNLFNDCINMLGGGTERPADATNRTSSSSLSGFCFCQTHTSERERRDRRSGRKCGSEGGGAK